MDANWAPARVRRNFRIDTFSAICGGVYISVLVTFMPIVVRRLGGSTTDVAIVIAAPLSRSYFATAKKIWRGSHVCGNTRSGALVKYSL